MLDFLRHLRPLDRFVMVPWLLLFPAYMAWVLSAPIIRDHGPGAFAVTLVTTAVAALLGVLLVHRHGDTYPATLSMGMLCAGVAEFILLAVSWNRAGLILTGFVHASVLTYVFVSYLEKKWQLERAAEKVVDDAVLEAAGGVRFSMQNCGDSACYCTTTKADYVLRA